jgi:AcrR family transcriptional regulator
MARPVAFDEEKILPAAAVIFAKDGFRNVTMQELADRLGVAKPTLYTHLTTKATILDKIVHRLTTRAVAVLDRATAQPDAVSGLTELMTGWVTLVAENQPSWYLFNMETREQTELGRSATRRHAALMLRGVTDLLRRAQDEGNVPVERDIEVLAQAVFGAINWTAQWMGATPKAPEMIGRELASIFIAQ